MARVARARSRSARSRRCVTRWGSSRVFKQVVDIFRLELMLQVGLATLLGGAIGLERELGGKPAVLRTNILICIGSVLYTHLSIAMLSALAGGGGTGTDPTRVAGQIVTGVGFIGAGTILHARGAVVGLTSAATSRQENVDLVIEFNIRGSKRLHDQVMITLVHHDHVRTVSTGE